jgi:hypothetical protein
LNILLLQVVEAAAGLIMSQQTQSVAAALALVVC